MYDPMTTVGVLIPFVKIHKGGDYQGSSGSGVLGEVLGEVFEVISYPDFTCFDSREVG